jgi:hypothetical protein
MFMGEISLVEVHYLQQKTPKSSHPHSAFITAYPLNVNNFKVLFNAHFSVTNIFAPKTYIAFHQ